VESWTIRINGARGAKEEGGTRRERERHRGKTITAHRVAYSNLKEEKGKSNPRKNQDVVETKEKGVKHHIRSEAGKRPRVLLRV